MAISLDNINNSQVKNTRGSNEPTSITKAAEINERKNGSASLDTLSLTSSGKFIQQLDKQLESLPVVDAEKVAVIKENINSGNYQVSSQRIAEKFTLYESYLQAAS